jgi:hypothetical protein
MQRSPFRCERAQCGIMVSCRDVGTRRLRVGGRCRGSKSGCAPQRGAEGTPRSPRVNDDSQGGTLGPAHGRRHTREQTPSRHGTPVSATVGVEDDFHQQYATHSPLTAHPMGSPSGSFPLGRESRPSRSTRCTFEFERMPILLPAFAVRSAVRRERFPPPSAHSCTTAGVAGADLGRRGSGMNYWSCHPEE